MSDANHGPTAEGTLEKTPFVHLVLYLQQQQSGGTLVVEPEAAPTSARSIVLFRGGRPVAGRFASECASLADGLLGLAALRAGTFTFYDDDLLGDAADARTGSVDPLRFVAHAAREHVPREAVDDVLRRYGGAPLRFSPRIDVSRLSLTAQEMKLVDLVRAEPADVATLSAQSELPPDLARRILYLLAVTRVIAPYESSASRTTGVGIHASPAGSAASVAASRPPAHNRSPSPPPGPSAGPRSISPPAAWQSIASRAGASLRPDAVPLGGRSGLISPTGTRSLTPRPSPPPLAALDTDAKIRRAEQLMARSAYDEALPFVRDLVAQEPKVAKHHGLLAQVLFGCSADRTTVAKEIVEAVNQALRLDEDEVHALYTKGLSYKRMGKEREALHYFKRAVGVDPSHIEAAREARLLRLRYEEAKDKKGK